MPENKIYFKVVIDADLLAPDEIDNLQEGLRGLWGVVEVTKFVETVEWTADDAAGQGIVTQTQKG